MAAPKINKLDEVVINRIAAGEVIQRPANAIKEMIENCIDAQSKSIQITVKNGGLKLIQIQDDGCGIRKEDMSIVCERFTTSKLNSFDDLKCISTYGFRGEALASISHVAHLTITTKTSAATCAFKARYEDGRLVPLQPGGQSDPKPCAGNKGTQILVEDLFYNVAVRRKAFKSPNEEHSKIADVISKYAIHNPSIGFSLKKHGENIANVRTPQSSTTLGNIKILYGPTVAKELLEISQKDEKYGYHLNGYISNANYSIKKFEFLLFINHRLVESSSLKKAIDAVYVNYLPKDKRPFVYMSLEINSLNVDVNVHPTKHEVKFLHEDVIIESIQKCVENKLLGANESRHYYTQMLLPKLRTTGSECPVSKFTENKSKNETPSKIYNHQMVRTDSRERKLEAFFLPMFTNLVTQETNAVPEAMENDLESDIASNVDNDTLKTNDSNGSGGALISNIPKVQGNDKVISNDYREIYELDDSSHISKKCDNNKNQCPAPNSLKRSIQESNSASNERVVKLTSIKKLRKRIDIQEHLGLKNLLEDHKFVGCVNKQLALIQHLTRLYLVNTENLSQHLFYQIIIFNFGNFGYIKLSSPAPILELVMLALNSPESGWTKEDGDKKDLAKFVTDLLKEKSEMLMDYFSIEINENGELLTLPILLDNYTPNWNKLPMFLLKLATEVSWDSELECFDTFSKECSRFFAISSDKYSDPLEENIDDIKSNSWKHVVEHVIYPALRNSIIPPRSFSEDGTFLEVANLRDLYKVFERC